jgi:hypothetical protein
MQPPFAEHSSNTSTEVFEMSILTQTFVEMSEEMYTFVFVLAIEILFIGND